MAEKLEASGPPGKSLASISGTKKYQCWDHRDPTTVTQTTFTNDTNLKMWGRYHLFQNAIRFIKWYQPEFVFLKA